jgi:DNA modification methylase
MNRIEFGDCRDTMRRWASEGVKVQTCVTSPPYFGLRDYGHEGQIGLEQTPEEYITAMVEVFRCVRDVLADDGTLWLNIGDSYGKAKQLLMIPARLALALQDDGWVLRQEIIWAKGISGEGSKHWAGACMPEPVKDRCVKSHEQIYLLSKRPAYFFDAKAIKEPNRDPNRTNYTPGKRAYAEGNTVQTPGERTRRNDGFEKYANGAIPDGRNRRSVWAVSTRPYKGAHFATFPPALIEPCILAGSRPNDIVLDPFMGSGTTAQVAIQHGRQYLGCELNQEYGDLQQERITKATPQKTDEAQMSLLEPLSAEA